jgi:hypothetical protein
MHLHAARTRSFSLGRLRKRHLAGRVTAQSSQARRPGSALRNLDHGPWAASAMLVDRVGGCGCWRISHQWPLLRPGQPPGALALQVPALEDHQKQVGVPLDVIHGTAVREPSYISQTTPDAARKLPMCRQIKRTQILRNVLEPLVSF